MKCRIGRLLILPLLLAGASGRGDAQRAGIWEAQAVVDGTPLGSPVRECHLAGAQLAIMQTWPAGCVAKPLQHTTSGITSEAKCDNTRTGPSLLLRQELTGDLDRRYRIVTSSRIDGTATTQPTHRSTVALRYLGPCAGRESTVSESDAASQRRPAREPLSIVIARIILPLILILGFISATGWFFRRRWRERREQSTVKNIVLSEAGEATIPVLVTFTGVRGLPWWYSIAMNNAAPLLVIEPDGLRFRVIRRQHRSFAEIACVDVHQAWRTVNLDFTFHGSAFTFAANVGTVALAAHVIASLPSGVPLSPSAQALKSATL